MKDKGYQAALERLAYELLSRVESIHNEMLLTGDTTRWDALNTNEGCNDPEFGEAFLNLDDIMWKMCETYNISMDQLQEEFNVVQQRMLNERALKVINDELWDYVK